MRSFSQDLFAITFSSHFKIVMGYYPKAMTKTFDEEPFWCQTQYLNELPLS